MKSFKLLTVAFFLAFMISCGGEKTDVVESGTYQGTVEEVEADKT